MVWDHYRTRGRHGLPWRRTRDPYKILVSEIMLQQTQVARVIPKYREFIRRFPNLMTLDRAPLSEVLEAWQGLGYNRRALALRRLAEVVVHEYDGELPRTVEKLESLPGIGPYTARAVAAFAWSTSSVFMETNIKTAVIHHFFQGKKMVADADIAAKVRKTLEPDVRSWYYALMDYGAELKKLHAYNSRIRGYRAQSKFKGSRREARGAVLKVVLERPRSFEALVRVSGLDRALLAEAVAMLEAEHLIFKTGDLLKIKGGERVQK